MYSVLEKIHVSSEFNKEFIFLALQIPTSAEKNGQEEQSARRKKENVNVSYSDEESAIKVDSR